MFHIGGREAAMECTSVLFQSQGADRYQVLLLSTILLYINKNNLYFTFLSFCFLHIYILGSIIILGSIKYNYYYQNTIIYLLYMYIKKYTIAIYMQYYVLCIIIIVGSPFARHLFCNWRVVGVGFSLSLFVSQQSSLRSPAKNRYLKVSRGRTS